MPLTFPRDMTTAYTWTKASLAIDWHQEHSQQANGVTIGKDLGSPTWKADFETEPMSKLDAEALHADFLTLGGVARTFYAHVASRPFPAMEEGADPLSPEIFNISAERDSIIISGLPTNYTFAAGDFVSIATAAGGLELAVMSVNGDSYGDDKTGVIYISPSLRPSVSVGNQISLTPPMIELRLDKGGLSEPKRMSGDLYTVAFKARQVVK